MKVHAKCVGCDARKEIGELDPGEQPMCDICFMPMVVV